MKRHVRVLTIMLALAIADNKVSGAQETVSAIGGAQESISDPAGRFLMGTGVFNLFDGRNQERVFASVEYRPPLSRWHVQPLVAFARAEGGATFASLGAVGDIPLGRRFLVSAGFAPTYHTPRGGWDLGSALEFYTFAEVTWQASRRYSVRARFGHLSNAGLGIINPGAESLQLSYALPLPRLWGGND